MLITPDRCLEVWDVASIQLSHFKPKSAWTNRIKGSIFMKPVVQHKSVKHTFGNCMEMFARSTRGTLGHRDRIIYRWVPEEILTDVFENMRTKGRVISTCSQEMCIKLTDWVTQTVAAEIDGNFSHITKRQKDLSSRNHKYPYKMWTHPVDIEIFHFYWKSQKITKVAQLYLPAIINIL